MKKPAPKPSGAKAAKAVPVTNVRLTNAGGRERSVEVRKIENGFIVRECTWDGKGDYKTSERFSAKPPEIKVDGAAMKAKK